MWIEKLTDGIIQLDTAIGPRYVQPNLLQRAYLLWTFRNFSRCRSRFCDARAPID